MTAKFEKTGTNTGTLEFTISRDLINPALNRVFDKTKKTISVPGFRKGKISRQMFDRMFGEEALYQDALNDVLNVAYLKAVEEAGVEAVGQPQIDVVTMAKGKDWEMKAEVSVKPEVKLGDYKNLSVQVDLDQEVTDKDVDERLEQAQNRMAELVIKEGKAASGDTVVIDFVGSVDGEEFEGGKGNNHNLELGSGQFIPGFEDQLIGHQAGDELEVTVTFPENYQATDLAGKEAVFVTKIHDVKTKEVPELDDELAKDIDDTVSSLDELKEKYREELETSKEEIYKDTVESAAIEVAVANAEIDEIPEPMVHDEIHRAMNEFLGGLQQQGVSPEMYYQITGTSEDDLHKQYEGEAEGRVKTNLVIEAIAKAEGFEVSSDEVDAEIADLSVQYNMPIEQIQTMLPRNMVEHDVRMKKAVEVITDSAKVKKTQGKEKKDSVPKTSTKSKSAEKKTTTKSTSTSKASANKSSAPQPAAKKTTSKK